MSRKPITMPALSDTMESGRLVSWLKRPGDPVKKGEAIAEVESDKAVMELEALDDGYLAPPLAEPGSELPVGATLGYLSDQPPTEEEQGSATENASQKDSETTATPSPARSVTPAGGETDALASAPAPAVEPVREPALPPRVHDRKRVSPYARALARELGLDPATLAPGPDGTIRSAQVIAAALRAPVADLDAGPPWKLEPLTPMQRAVAESMSATVYTPTFRVGASLSLSPLQEAAHARNLSLTLLLARACALSVTQHPRFNAAYMADGLAIRERVDVGIAVDLPDGLVTPVLRDVAGKELATLAADWQRLRDAARKRRLQQRDYSGATFYLSNLGTFPVVRHFDAIVPVGAAAILAVGAERNGEVECTLSCDHRVVYGADAARFLQTLAQHLEKPETILT